MATKIFKNLDKQYVPYYKWVEENKRNLLSKKELTLHQYDWVRFAVSIALLDDYYGNNDLKVLELGAPGASTKLLKSYFPKWKTVNYQDDLRGSSWNLPKDSFDLILNMEVLEHLTDLYLGEGESNEYCYDYNGKFVYSGALNCMFECNRVLKPEGYMFLTTPNVHAYINLYKMLVGEIPYQWPNHIREYTLQELEGIIEESGFLIKDSVNKEILCSDWDFSYLQKYIKDNKFKVSNRWSGFFFNLSVSKKKTNLVKKRPLSYLEKIQLEKDMKIKKLELLLNQKDLQIKELMDSNLGNMKALEIVTNSLSWKLTKPIRLLKQLIKKIFLK